MQNVTITYSGNWFRNQTMLPVSQRCRVVYAYFQPTVLLNVRRVWRERKTKHSSIVQTIGRREHTIVQQKGGGQKIPKFILILT